MCAGCSPLSVKYLLPPQEQACLLEADMLDYMPACRGLRRLSGSGHRLRLSPGGLSLCVYLAVPQRGQFTVLQLVSTDSGRYSLDHVSSVFTTQVSRDVAIATRPRGAWRACFDVCVSAGDAGGLRPDRHRHLGRLGGRLQHHGGQVHRL